MEIWHTNVADHYPDIKINEILKWLEQETIILTEII